jgi:hypothetical protein
VSAHGQHNPSCFHFRIGSALRLDGVVSGLCGISGDSREVQAVGHMDNVFCPACIETAKQIADELSPAGNPASGGAGLAVGLENTSEGVADDIRGSAAAFDPAKFAASATSTAVAHPNRAGWEVGSS